MEGIKYVDHNKILLGEQFSHTACNRGHLKSILYTQVSNTQKFNWMDNFSTHSDN